MYGPIRHHTAGTTDDCNIWVAWLFGGQTKEWSVEMHGV